MPDTLMDVVKAPLRANPSNSVIAFKDNSSALRGYLVQPLLPATPGSPSPLWPQERDWDVLLTAETHNFPCAVAPYPGGPQAHHWSKYCWHCQDCCQMLSGGHCWTTWNWLGKWPLHNSSRLLHQGVLNTPPCAAQNHRQDWFGWFDCFCSEYCDLCGAQHQLLVYHGLMP